MPRKARQRAGPERSGAKCGPGTPHPTVLSVFMKLRGPCVVDTLELPFIKNSYMVLRLKKKKTPFFLIFWTHREMLLVIRVLVGSYDLTEV